MQQASRVHARGGSIPVHNDSERLRHRLVCVQRLTRKVVRLGTSLGATFVRARGAILGALRGRVEGPERPFCPAAVGIFEFCFATRILRPGIRHAEREAPTEHNRDVPIYRKVVSSCKSRLGFIRKPSLEEAPSHCSPPRPWHAFPHQGTQLFLVRLAQYGARWRAFHGSGSGQGVDLEVLAHAEDVRHGCHRDLSIGRSDLDVLAAHVCR